ncbi:MAG: NAD kinase [Flavobacteriales bacterium]
MRIAVYGRSFNDSFNEPVQQLFDQLGVASTQVSIFEPFATFLKSRLTLPSYTLFNTSDDLKNKVDYLLSVGGDGCMLDTVSLVSDAGIPVLGINTGRLGFLSHTSSAGIAAAIKALKAGNITLEERALLELQTPNNLFGKMNRALNEVTVHKKDSTSMVTVHTYVDGHYLNSYWADGLIIATPTGSTAYSLSCGGPIVAPGSRNFVITPIAPHNLNVRPLVLNDDSVIKLKAEGRSKQYLISLDSRSEPFDSDLELTLKRAKNGMKLIQLADSDFFMTIRNKLTWGIDKRN